MPETTQPKIEWTYEHGVQDIYARTPRRWARVTRNNKGWHVAQGFYGDYSASYGMDSTRKRRALAMAEEWVLDS